MNRNSTNFEGSEVNRASGRFAYFVRRTLRTLGILVLMIMGAFLMSQHLLRPTIPVGEAFAQGGAANLSGR